MKGLKDAVESAPQEHNRRGRFLSGSYERGALLAILLVFFIVSFFSRNWFDVSGDNPSYTDPAASFISGQGFTSGCWYVQGNDEFWAGNVPLHQLLMIPWLKLVGFSYGSVMALNLMYIVFAMGVLWVGLARSAAVSTPGLRIGLIGFLLMSDSSVGLAYNGRAEPICVLIASLAFFALTLEKPVFRWLLLGACGFLAPWTALVLTVCFAVAGGLTLLFYPRRWKDVVALGMGGVLGTIALLVFYKEAGVLQAFIASIAPHMTTGGDSTFRTNYRHRLGGLGCATIVETILLSFWACSLGLLKKRSTRLALLDLACLFALPSALIVLGVFPQYYGIFLQIPAAVLLFAVISDDGIRRNAMVFLLALSFALPGSYLRHLCKGAMGVSSQNNERVAQFIREVVHPNDVAWVPNKCWYVTKPIASQTFSGSWAGISQEKLTVMIREADPAKPWPDFLAGNWRQTGESLELQDRRKPLLGFHPSQGPSTRLEVYRRAE